MQYLATLNRILVPKRALMITLELIDSHKWTVAREITSRFYSRKQPKKDCDKDFNDLLVDFLLLFGHTKDICTGNKFNLDDNPHWQIRFECGSDDEEHIKELLWHLDPNYYMEKAELWTDYERKMPYFWSKDELKEPIQIRKTPEKNLRPVQKAILSKLKSCNDREILFIVDPKGGAGKTFLVEWLFEHGQAVYLRHTKSDPGRDLASCYSGQPIVCIDVPRSSALRKKDYEFIEMLKDGLISDERFTNTSIHVRGIKVMVMLNYSPDFSKLSSDRFKVFSINYVDGVPVLDPVSSASEILSHQSDCLSSVSAPSDQFSVDLQQLLKW